MSSNEVLRLKEEAHNLRRRASKLETQGITASALRLRNLARDKEARADEIREES
jgi:hypothetical protein